MDRGYHIGLTRSAVEGAVLAILPGDPARVGRIAAHLEQPRDLGMNREFHSAIGTLAGQRVLVTSTGIGGPSAAIAVEELAMLGILAFLRVGTTGAIRAGIEPGDVIISSGAVRLDGASRHIAPLAYPAVADYRWVSALVQAAGLSGVTAHVGVTVSSDTFYQGQGRRETFTGHLQSRFHDSVKKWGALNALAFEMEAATIFTQASAYGLSAGCITGVLVNRLKQENVDAATVSRVEEVAIAIAVAAASAFLQTRYHHLEEDRPKPRDCQLTVKDIS